MFSSKVLFIAAFIPTTLLAQATEPVVAPKTESETKAKTETKSESTPEAKPAAPTPTPAAKKDAAQSVDKVEVKGQRFSNEDRRNSSAAKIIITREEIEQYGDSNLGDVMRRLPGVTQGGRPGRGGPVRMRGMGGGATQMLLNGERVPPGFSMEQITPEQVERIEILRAPTAETGTRAVAGTINVILREPLRIRNNDLRVALTEERGKISPNLSWTQNDSFSPTGTYNFTVSLNGTDQLNQSRNRSVFTNTQTNVIDQARESSSNSANDGKSIFASGRMQWRLGAGEMFSIQPFFVKNNTTTTARGTLSQSVGITPAPYATSNSNSSNDINVTRFMTMLNKTIDPQTRVELRGGAGRFKSSSKNNIDEFSTAGALVLNQNTNTQALDSSWNIVGKITRNLGAGSEHKLVSGVEFENTKRDEQGTTILNGALQLADFGSELNVSTRRTAFYIQDEWDPSPKISAYGGLRWEGIETRSESNGAARPSVRNQSRVLNPLAQMVWRFDPPDRDQVRLGLTQSYRTPSTQQLVARPSLNTQYPVPGTNTSTNVDRAGNPNLKPEIANGIDLAYENYLEGGGIISINLFTRQIRDLIRNNIALENVSYATVPRYVSRPQNIGRATTSGVEIDAKFQLNDIIKTAPAVNLRVNLSLLHSKVDGLSGPNNRLEGQPKATGNIGGDYRFRGTPFSVGGNLAFTPAYETRESENQSISTGVKRVFDAYGLWNIDGASRLRLTLSNIAPRDSTSTNNILQGLQLQSSDSITRTDLNVALRYELRF